MKKRFNVVISTVLALTLALSGVSYVSLKNTEADTVAAMKTITFDDESDIIAKNDSAATIVDDAERGKVVSLGAGDATKALVGAEIKNPWGDATVNPEGAKEYTVEDIKYAYNYALALPYGATFRDDVTDKPTHPTLPTQYLVRPEGEGGVTWRSLDVAVGVPLQNGAVAENTEKSINDMNTGEYKGGEHAKSVLGDTYAATRIKRGGKEIEFSDGTKAAVSAYKVEKEADYVRPQWDKEDGLTMSVWVKAPEGTEADTVLLSFFNDRIVEAMDSETANFNNKTGHFTVRADGSVEFMELSRYAGDPNEPANSQKYYGRYAASRNRFTSPAIGTEEGVNVLANPGEWVCVTLVVENDYVSVYFDGIQVNYIESFVVTGDTDEGKFTQDWENPENSPSWTRAEVETLVKTFNGWFGSRNTPTYVLVNSGVYASFPSWSVSARSTYKRQPYPVEGCEGAATLANRPRITLCQWLQDSATTLYLGGSSNKDLSAGTYNEATGVTTYTAEDCEKQYKLVAGTMFDDIEFYGEALTATEVATAFVNAGGTLEATPEPTESTNPTPTESTDPTPTDTPDPGYGTLSGELVSVVLKDATYHASWGIDSSLAVGDLVYGDRDRTFVTVDESLVGSEYIVTACDSKNTTTDLAVVTASEDIVLSVGFDARVTSIPEWAADFTKTEITCENDRDVVFVIYQKEVKAGESVTLGSLGQSSGVVGYVAMATAAGTVVPTESTDPAPTESTDPTPTESTDPTPTESTDPTPTESTDPTPTESTDPTPTETVTPDPTETATPEPTETVAPVYTIGDVNDDGKVDAADALMVLKYAAKIDISAETFIEEAAHTNSDTNIDAQDALNILKLAAKIIDSLPVE